MKENVRPDAFREQIAFPKNRLNRESINPRCTDFEKPQAKATQLLRRLACDVFNASDHSTEMRSAVMLPATSNWKAPEGS
jgi:hypothetical protein